MLQRASVVDVRPVALLLILLDLLRWVFAEAMRRNDETRRT